MRGVWGAGYGMSKAEGRRSRRMSGRGPMQGRYECTSTCTSKGVRAGFSTYSYTYSYTRISSAGIGDEVWSLPLHRQASRTREGLSRERELEPCQRQGRRAPGVLPCRPCVRYSKASPIKTSSTITCPSKYVLRICAKSEISSSGAEQLVQREDATEVSFIHQVARRFRRGDQHRVHGQAAGIR